MSVIEESQVRAETEKWIFDTCGWVYDSEEGDPDGGLPAGTAFEEIPGDWMCPVCGARKSDLREMEPGEDIPEDVD